MELRRLLVVPIVLLLLGAGVVGLFTVAGMSPAAVGPTITDDPEGTENPDGTDSSVATGGEIDWMDEVDLENDPIGCIGEVCHDDELGINQSDGLTDEEFTLLVKQSMARVEYFRDQRFKEPVPVELMSREEYQEQFAEDDSDAGDDKERPFDRWNDQVWKALWIVDGETSAAAEIDRTFGTAVAGFYSPSRDEITLIVDDEEEPAIPDTTLVHELGHAMQDQYHDLSDSRYDGATQDEDLAIDGIVEGEVVYVETKYEQRCDAGEWECASPPPTAGSGGGEMNFGIFLTVFQPYSDGPGYAHDIVQETGWEGIDERMEEPPVSTTQIIHRTDREPRSIEFEDEATDGWETYPDQGVDGAETVGEASIYAMFYYQSREYDAGAIDWGELTDEPHPYETYSYVSEPSAGWAGDELYPYRRGEDDGYVWVTEWETPEDALEFYDGYEAILAAHDADLTDEGIHVVDGGGFDGAYGVHVEDTRVTIVHGPTAAAIDELRPGVADSLAAGDGIPDEAALEAAGVGDDDDADGGGDGADETDEETDVADETDGEADVTDERDRETDAGDTAEAIPGFTPIAAVVAIGGTVVLFVFRSRD